MAKRKIGYAVIGLGHISQHALLPAFKNAKSNSRLVALVSGDREKRDELGARYKVPTFDYDELDECLDLPDVDAVYIGLPNDQHAEYTERCARKGVHVLCEKPMGVSSAECLRMIRACADADVKLMIAYRLHLERANLKAIEKIIDGKIGEPRYYSSVFSYQVEDDNIRVIRERGGGPQWDIGLYCISAARYLFRSEPLEVFAFSATKAGDARFTETPEMVTAVMKFPDERIAQFTCSFGAAAAGSWELLGTEGMLRLENAFEYEGERTLRWTVNDEPRKRKFAPNDQFGPELVYFSDCIIKDREPEMNGYEGLADVRIIEAINESIERGAPVSLVPFKKRSRPVPAMVQNRPPVVTDDLVEAEAPHQE